MKKRDKIVFFISVVIFLIFFITYQFKNDLSFPSKILPNKYLHLIKDENINEIEFQCSFISESLDTFSLFSYKKEYLLLFYKFPSPVFVPLTKYLSEKKAHSFIGIKVCQGFKFGNFEFSYLPQETAASDTLIFKHCCETNGFSVINYKEAYFSSKVSSTSFQFSKDGQDNLVLRSILGSDLSISIQKKGNDIYFVAMTPSESRSMDYKLLLNILK